jgi:hypothetical protein
MALTARRIVMTIPGDDSTDIAEGIPVDGGIAALDFGEDDSDEFATTSFIGMTEVNCLTLLEGSVAYEIESYDDEYGEAQDTDPGWLNVGEELVLSQGAVVHFIQYVRRVVLDVSRGGFIHLMDGAENPSVVEQGITSRYKGPLFD